MSRWPDIVPFLATRCLYLGSTSDWMSAWSIRWQTMSRRPDLIPFLAMKCLYKGRMFDWISAWHIQWPNTKMTWCSTILGHEMPLPRRYIWLNVSLTQRITNVKMTWCSSALNHQMPLLANTYDWMSAWPTEWPNVKMTLHCSILGHQIPLLAGYIWLNVSLIQRMTKCQDDLILVLFLEHQMSSTRGVHLNEYQPNTSKDDQMSRWLDM